VARAAKLFRASALRWSAIASRAAAVLEASGPYADLVERRMFRLMCDPTGAGATVRELSEQIDLLGAAESDLPADQRAALFAELADLVDAARIAEETAVTLLR
jgi:hypothetical protein